VPDSASLSDRLATEIVQALQVTLAQFATLPRYSAMSKT
jgi:hypothetical protein